LSALAFDIYHHHTPPIAHVLFFLIDTTSWKGPWEFKRCRWIPFTNSSVFGSREETPILLQLQSWSYEFIGI